MGKVYGSVLEMVEDISSKETTEQFKAYVSARSEATSLTLRRVKLNYTEREMADCLSWPLIRLKAVENASNKTLAGLALNFWNEYQGKLIELEARQ